MLTSVIIKIMSDYGGKLGLSEAVFTTFKEHDYCGELLSVSQDAF
jgi:hypothetical protein